MKYNAFSTGSPTLHRVWGESNVYQPTWVLPDDTPVFVLFSPLHKRWIMSITTPDFRYDAFVLDSHFRLDPALSVPDAPAPDAPRYYLDKIRSK